MRPALLRLLKRPSALSVLESLISSPPVIEHLEPQLHEKCLRCYSSAFKPLFRQARRSRPPPPKNGASNKSKRLSKIRLAPIEPHPTSDAKDNDYASIGNKVLGPWKDLGLHPERLEYESDVGHTHDIGTRLVDDPAHRDDISLWLELLRYRQRHYGDKGVLQIWEGMMKRVGGLQLPVEGETANFFWQSFVDYGLKHEAFLNQVLEHALELQNQTGKRWSKLYQSIVGSFVKLGMERQAVKWHKRVQGAHGPANDDVAGCFTLAMSDSDISEKVSGGFRARMAAFRAICKHTDGHRVYGHVISALMASGKSKELLRMHEFLIGQGDHPRSLEEVQPLLEYVRYFSNSTTRSRLRRYLDERFAPEEAIDSGMPCAVESAPEVDVKSESDDNGLKDEFGARIFATKALSLDMIISGLKTFRVSAIGPQSLRELARRAGGSQDLLAKLEQLEQSNISIGNSVFVRLLRQLASYHEEILLSDLIHSDQHHDVLEDAETQSSLLISHYAAGDLRQYNLTLVVLKELLGEGPEMLRIHFQKHIAAGENDLAASIVAEMLAQGSTLTKETMGFMITYLFGPRRPGRRPVNQPNLRSTHTLQSAFKYVQNIALAGTNVPVELWIEVVKRYGMIARWGELRACCLWLTRRYDPRVPGNDPLILQRIFNPQMQEAIVSWGFIIEPPTMLRMKGFHATGMQGEPLVPFVRGILLLRELREKGVHVKSSLIGQVSERRLIMLYSQTPFFSNRARNRELRKENPYLLSRVIEDINCAWGQPYLYDRLRKESLKSILQNASPKLTPRHRADRANMWKYMDKYGDISQ
ncbi:uncharacterized protein DSM5745_04784 [Aspergillus mulundensis]|uniref:Uncharacterized protein n=1 Tax=Aspergillus mulundensis TaxID=1810919 RepID=A0A3D8S4K4_9EURO|nr:Uncharacterized protein DSM5745_04784 [Aspergillus mulundensis]RDW81227.1 Uncharacterized protein DSM5745_04784 [Aspergillus mulundensis]